MSESLESYIGMICIHTHIWIHIHSFMYMYTYIHTYVSTFRLNWHSLVLCSSFLQRFYLASFIFYTCQHRFLKSPYLQYLHHHLWCTHLPTSPSHPHVLLIFLLYQLLITKKSACHCIKQKPFLMRCLKLSSFEKWARCSPIVSYR